VLAVLYLMFNEGYLSSLGGSPARRDLAEDAAWLASLLTRLLPAEPEPLGLLALMRLHLARAAARFDGAGDLVLISDQDRSRWDGDAIAAAIGLVERAGAMRRPGPYQLQAAIAACHAEAPSWAATDWRQIVVLYDLLLRHSPTPVVRLNRAVALRWVAGVRAALAEVEALAGALDGYHLFHAARAELLLELGRPEEARAAEERALALTANRAERALLERRLGGAAVSRGGGA
jgi:predicted RNA polymerase sigma factor